MSKDMLRDWVKQHFTIERWRGDEADIHCPLHNDSHSSASINVQKAVWNCQVCNLGGKLTILAKELGIEPPPFSGNGRGKLEVARFDYRDAKGKVLYQVVRFSPKDFRQFDPATKKWSIKGLERVPYRLPELLSGIKTGKVVWITEGEKDVEAFVRLGLVATCNQGGVGSSRLWRGFAKKYLPAGTRVMLCPDADTPGLSMMEEIGGYLMAVGCKVKIIDLGYPISKAHGRDISDWIAEGHTREELLDIARNAAPFEPRDSDAATTQGEPVKDLGHAAVLARRFHRRFRWAPHRGCWMRWTDKVWQPEEEEYVAKVAADTLRAEYGAQIGEATEKVTLQRLLSLVKETCVYARITGALSFLKGWDGILTRADEWDQHPWMLNVGNGILDLKTGQLSKHDPDRLLTKLVPMDFELEAVGPAWQAHLERFLPKDNIRRQLQRDLGMALVGTTIDELLPIWYGTGGNGKSTTTAVLRNVLGDYVREAAPNLLVLTKFEQHPTEIAELSQRRIIFSSEIGQGKRLDEQRVKEITGGGQPKRAHFMRQDNFDVEQTFTIFMLVNHHPVITGTDHAIWRRVRLIPWTEQIPDSKKLPQDEIVNKLSIEGPAVLAWLVAGLADWQRDRGWMAPEVRAATAEYRAEQDRLGAFLDDVCEEAAHYTVPVGELYEVYTGWCNDVGEDPLGKTALGRRLKERGKTSKRAGHENRSTWYGLRLKKTRNTDLRHNATSPPISPLENGTNLEEQGKHSRKMSQPENTLALVDNQTLLANELKLRNYLDDETIPFEEREKRTGGYKALVEEIARRKDGSAG